MFFQGFLMVLDVNEEYKLEFSLLLATSRVYRKQTELNVHKEQQTLDFWKTLSINSYKVTASFVKHVLT